LQNTQFNCTRILDANHFHCIDLLQLNTILILPTDIHKALTKSQNELKQSAKPNLLDRPPQLKKSGKQGVGETGFGGAGILTVGGHGSITGVGHGSITGVGHGSITGVGHGSITGVGHGSITGVGHGSITGVGHGSITGVGHGSITGVGHGGHGGHGSITGVGHGSGAGVGHGTYRTRPEIYEATDLISTKERVNKPHYVCQSMSTETPFFHL